MQFGPGAAFQINFGTTGDVAVPGDYDGDGKTDAAIYRPSTGLWSGPRTGGNTLAIQEILGGQACDVPIPCDYDGDGKTDPGFFRNGQVVARLSGGGISRRTSSMCSLSVLTAASAIMMLIPC